MEIKCDYDLSKKEHEELLELLMESFPGYFKDRLYFKNIPAFRVLERVKERVIAHAGVDYRVIHSQKNGPLSIFGIVDLCVCKDHQNKGIAGKIISFIKDLAQKKSIDALVLFADDHPFYLKHGFENNSVTCRFLAIEDLSSVCVLEKDMSDCFMIRSLHTNLSFQNDHIDMLGPVF